MKLWRRENIFSLIVLNWLDIEHAENRCDSDPHFRLRQPSAWANSGRKSERADIQQQSALLTADRNQRRHLVEAPQIHRAWKENVPEEK